MSQKLIVKNFWAIKEAEIELDQMLVLIGQQASVLLPLAKLVYFFGRCPGIFLILFIMMRKQVQRHHNY
jgi:hypothetical protein